MLHCVPSSVSVDDDSRLEIQCIEDNKMLFASLSVRTPGVIKVKKCTIPSRSRVDVAF